MINTETSVPHNRSCDARDELPDGYGTEISVSVVSRGNRSRLPLSHLATVGLVDAFSEHPVPGRHLQI